MCSFIIQDTEIQFMKCALLTKLHDQELSCSDLAESLAKYEVCFYTCTLNNII